MTWYLAKGDDFLPDFSIDEIRRLQREETSSKAKLRLLVALKRKEGQPFDGIASQLEMKRITVNKLLHRFQERGISAKEDEKRSGRPKRLTQAQLKDLRGRLIAGPRKGASPMWTTKAVRAYVKKNYKKDFTERHMRRLLHQLGFSIQKPRPRHYKTNPDAQAHFKKTSKGGSTDTATGGSASSFWTSAP